MRIKTLTVFSGLLVASALAGCASTPGHGCPLDHGLGCHSLTQAYAAAITPGAGNVQSVFGKPNVATVDRQVGTPSVLAEPSVPATGYPQGGPGGTPVWTPGHVYRAWTAPWTDAEGYLHSGGYVYFNTPGHWSYGSLTATGPGAGVLHPIAPSELGFRPTRTKPPVQPQSQVNSVDGATRSVMNNLNANGGITQPAEQITQ